MTALVESSGTSAWVAQRLDVRLRTTSSPVGLDLADLVGLAVRRNPRRAHLLVSRVLGKHVPTDPRVVRGAGLLLGGVVRAELGGGELPSGRGDALRSALAGSAAGFDQIEAREPVPAVVLGYAETATALGQQVAEALGAPVLHSTRRRVPGIEPLGGFEEEHSHATSHLLLPADPALLRTPGTLVLVDDELTTGRTALNTIAALHADQPRERYVVAALVDLRTAADVAAMAAVAERLGTRIDVVALAAGTVELPDDVGARAADLIAALDGPAPVAAAPGAPAVRVALPWPADLPESARHGWDPADEPARAVAVAVAAETLAAVLPADASPDGARVLVLGTEELLDVPQRLAAALADGLPALDVRVSSTTRSPVLVVDDDGYAMRTALAFDAHDEPEDGPGPRFAYNVAGGGFDVIVVVLDEPADTPAADALLAALATAAPRVVVATLPDTAARVARGRSLPPALHGPEFGSYAADEVSWLLTDLSDVALEAPVEEREEAIQSGGAHYAESLPVEYQPSATYAALFEEALADAAERVALAVGVVTERALAARGGELTLVSLARAGTPIGILMRRWARAVHGIEVPHYAVSIVRGRGVDHVALQHVAARHDPASVLFVDGWTGKGAIARELAAALVEHRATTGVDFPADLAVLADPGHCVTLYGTRDDFLIPSACLNSTVSGLVSRTVLNRQILREDQFHGAKFYAELAGADVSNRFLDAVSARFADVRAAVDATPAAPDDEPDWRGWAAVERVSVEQGIGDVNLVKPGVGETTRVLLRRVPWKVLVRADADPADLVHIRHLAAERGVPVEEVPDLPYSCMGLIHPAYTAGATGASGTAVRTVAP
ncbi:phosphoribosyltransferase [Cellulomonas rhizosphaerae]|uniref:Phosphoribosyltransferase n=1 Tax=Cellulomonas rhizosphaerae TaxID=2293719 RepID=A0A413RQU8_9CELL|nr:phosphoribosyltransferase [Cellulomonas rhizosphaerae]RHA44314.1 phosphoribosyltransferase [Cellulomonas rhizosphaerae]